MKKIWCVGAWSDNYGDRILQKANSDLLKEKIQNIDIVYINCQKTYFSPQLIDYMNKDADMLFIAGGGLIFNRPQDKSYSGWQWNIRQDDLRRINIPIVVNAIGYNKFPHDNAGFKSGMWEHIQETIDKSMLFSVRNNGTLQTLKDNGINISKVCITPDCGMFIKPEKFLHPIFKTDGPKIGLNWATDRANQRFNNDGVNKLKLVLDFCKYLTIKYNATIYLLEHLMPNELNEKTKIETRKLFKEILQEKGRIIYDELNQELYPMFDYNAPFFADIYKQMDLVLGKRGHSSIVSFGMNTPFISLGQHNKVKWFLEDLNMSDCIVELKDTDEDDMNKLNLIFDRIFDNAIYKDDMKHKLSDQKAKQQLWFSDIANIIKY